ncbi:30S ribosomal protein s3 chloroplastic, partial [Phtheirospermum japonicum]
SNHTSHSLWFAQTQNYYEGLQEDKEKIIDFIKNYVKKNMRISFGADGTARIRYLTLL